MIYPLLIFSDWALLVLRLAVAAIFLAHGWPKIKDLKTNANNFSAMGFNPGWFWGTAVAFLEGGFSMLLVLGLGVQIFGILMAVQMLVAAVWKKMKPNASFTGGYELDIVLAAACLVLATAGGGVFALDQFFRFW